MQVPRYLDTHLQQVDGYRSFRLHVQCGCKSVASSRRGQRFLHHPCFWHASSYWIEWWAHLPASLRRPLASPRCATRTFTSKQRLEGGGVSTKHRSRVEVSSTVARRVRTVMLEKSPPLHTCCLDRHSYRPPVTLLRQAPRRSRQPASLQDRQASPPSSPSESPLRLP